MKVKKTLMSVLACMLSIVLMISFAACTNKNNDEPKATVVSIELAYETLTLGPADTENLKAVVTMSDGKTGNVDEWSTSNAEVATVTRGIVTAVAAGTATITAKAGDLTATCAVTVENVTVTLDKTTLSMDRSAEGEQLTATVLKDGVAMEGETVEWTSSNTSAATVDKNGFVTPVSEGTTTITATRSGHAQKATCEVTVTWQKPVGYNEIEWAEQNKLPSNTWGYWNSKDANWAQGGLATDHKVYTDETFVESDSTLKDGYKYIQMGRITFEYEITNAGPNWTYQAFYRSSNNVEGGLLEYNHVYEVTFKIVANQSGNVTVNPYDDIRGRNDGETVEEYNAYLLAQETAGKILLARDGETLVTNEDDLYVTNHTFALEANVEQEITVVFLHDDCGYVYEQGIYDNMGSALHLQLADFETNKYIILSVQDFQYKDLGAAENPGVCDESKHAGASSSVEIPKHPEAPEVKPVSAVTATDAYLSDEVDGKALFVIEGTLDLSQFNNSVDEAKAWLHDTHFDGQQSGGSWTEYAFERYSVEVDAEGNFVIKYDVTYLPKDNGGSGAYTIHFTEKEEGEAGYSDNKYRDLKLDEEHAVPGQSIEVNGKTYSIVNIVGGSSQQENWGCVSIKVEGQSTVTPDPDPNPDNGEFTFNGEGDAVANPDKLFYWNDQNWCGSNVTVSQAIIEENGDYTLTYSGATTACWFGLQLFYKDSTHVTGNEYTLTLHINASVAGQITVNGQVCDLVTGDNTLTVTYTETANASMSVQFGVEAAGTVIEGGTFTFNFSFEGEGTETPVEKAYEIDSTSMTLVQEGDKVYLTVSGTYSGYTADDFRMDVQFVGGAWPNYGDWTNIVVLEDGTFTIKYDVTVAGPGEYVAHVFVGGASNDTGFNALPDNFGTTVSVGSTTYTLGTDEKGWGFQYTVTLTVVDTSAKEVKINAASFDLVAEGDKALVKLTIETTGFDSEDDLKAYLAYGNTDGAYEWKTDCYKVEKVEDGVYNVYFDITDMVAGGDGQLWSNVYLKGVKTEIKDSTHASHGKSITVGGKTYTVVCTGANGTWDIPCITVS